MKIFDWSQVTTLYLHLQSPRMQLILNLFAREIASYLEEDRYTRDFYHYNPNWLKLWKEKGREDRINSILELGFGPLSPCQSSERYLQEPDWNQQYLDDILQDEEDYRILSNIEFRDINRIEHYAWYHQCQCMAIFTWELLLCIYPNKQWEIIWNGYHAYVVEKHRDDLAYDILAYTIPSAADDMYDSHKLVRFATIEEYVTSEYCCESDELVKFYQI